MDGRDAVRVDLVREDLVIYFPNGRTALLRLHDLYGLAVEREAFVEDPMDEAEQAVD